MINTATASNKDKSTISNHFFYLSALIVALLLLIKPLTVSTVPPLLDYSIHLSRSYIIDNYRADPFLNQIYKIDWRPMPNLASDILLLPLLSFFDIEVAGRILVGCCTVLNVLGVLSLYRANFGHLSWWPLISVLPAYHGALSSGFLNYSVGVSFLLFALAGSVLMARQRSALKISAMLLSSLILLFCHVIVFGLYIIFTFFYHVFSDNLPFHSFLKRCIYSVKLHILPTLIPLLIYFQYSLSQVVARENHLLIGEWTLGSKIRGILMPLLSGDLALDVLSLIVVAGSVIFLVVSRQNIISRGLIPGAAIVLSLFLVLPGHMVDAAFISDRLTIPAVLVIIGSISPSLSNNKLTLVTASVVASLLLARTSSLSNSWLASHEYYQRLSHAIEKIEPGSSVMISSPLTDIGGQGYLFWFRLLSSSPRWHFALVNIPTLHSLPALPLTQRSSFSQLHFVWADKQILSLANPFQELDYGDGGASTWKPDVILNSHDDGSLSISDHADRFDYILFVYADHLEQKLRDRLATLSPVYVDDGIILLKHSTKMSWKSRFDRSQTKTDPAVRWK